ncbi:hypothetical protein [uncultured Parabacteroides sp.]|uniref:hypothetical protein n=1 Tax=uncultured Parabacteroides sp. TaxID=512312 RepID=UPI0026055EEB|nr:hypothetical protein [uncultured Parabacteroides sp.]
MIQGLIQNEIQISFTFKLKAPRQPWTPAERFKDLLKDITILKPENLLDTYPAMDEIARKYYW